MKIKEITSQSRRDFWATMECEHCGNIQKEVLGYDDANFHLNVIPKMKCGECDKIAPEKHVPSAMKYYEIFGRICDLII